uniref:Uncharacterized protein n=1 Tax=Rhizophora mucronata TaxID=61149 RepID=A0A2P2QP59_RHIMU
MIAIKCQCSFFICYFHFILMSSHQVISSTNAVSFLSQ